MAAEEDRVDEVCKDSSIRPACPGGSQTDNKVHMGDLMFSEQVSLSFLQFRAEEFAIGLTGSY